MKDKYIVPISLDECRQVRVSRMQPIKGTEGVENHLTKNAELASSRSFFLLFLWFEPWRHQPSALYHLASLDEVVYDVIVRGTRR